MLNNLIPELYCSNLKVSLEFYINNLGFRIVYLRKEEGFVMLEREGVRIMLEELTNPARKWITAPLEKPFGRGVNFQILTTDIDALYSQLILHHVHIFMPIEDKSYRTNDTQLHCRQFIVQDPDGYLLRFMAIKK